MKKKFPRFTRINPARLVGLFVRGQLFVLAIALLGFNIYTKIVLQQSIPTPLIELLKRPQERTMDDKKVLGASNQLAILEEESDRAISEYSYWEQVAVQKPNYQDALIMLTLLAYQQGLDDQARQYIIKAESLNPNNSYVMQLKYLLEEGH